MTPDKSPVIAIMRPEGYLEESVELARSYGFDVIAVPMIEIVDHLDDSFEGFVEKVLGRLCDYVIFTSANGIKHTLSKIPEGQRQDFIDSLNSTNVIAIGPNTRKALINAGIGDSGMPEVYSSTGLVDYMCKEVEGKSVYIARSSYGAPILVSGLEDCGASVFETQVYTLALPDGEKQKGLISSALEGKVSIFAFTSSMMVRNFFSQAESIDSGEQIVDVLNNSIVAAIGIPTADTLRGYGVYVDIIPDKYIYEEILIEAKKLILDDK